MNAYATTAEPIEVHEVPESERAQVLPRHFGRHMLTVEQAIFTFMRELAPKDTGGYWRFLELGNGGFYMAPEDRGRFEIRVEGNGFEGEMSADAAGITACLFAFSHLSFQLPDESIAQHYHQLREFALDHPEVGRIFAAID